MKPISKKAEAELIAIIEETTSKLEALNVRSQWAFDPQKAVDLIFGEPEQHPYQRLIYTYLFLSWALTPGETEEKSPHLRPLASSVALRIMFASMDKKGEFTSAPLIRFSDIQNRLAEPQFKELYEMFVVPTGGLRNSTNAINQLGQDRIRRDKFTAAKVPLAIVDYLAKAVQCGSPRLSRAWCQRAINADVLCKGVDFYTTRRGEKRRQAAEAQIRSGGNIRTMSPTAFDEVWGRAPRSILLLYFLEGLMGADVKQLFSRSQVLRALADEQQGLAPLRQALVNYQTVANAFAKHAEPNTKAATLWCPVKVPSRGAVAHLPEFNSEQLEKFKRLRV